MAKLLPPGVRADQMPRGVSWQHLPDHDSPHMFIVRDPSTGKRTTKCFERPIDGVRWADTHLAGLKTHTAAPGKHKILWKDLVDDYLAKMRAAKRRPASITNATYILGRLTATGVRGIQDPKFPEIVSTFIANLDQSENLPRAASPDGLSHSTRIKYLNTIKTVIKYARQRFLLPTNPLATVKLDAIDKAVMDVLPVDDLARCLAPERESHPYFFRFALLAYLGVRDCEGLHLRWPDYDMKRGVIKVRRQDHLYDLKSGEREIRVPTELTEILLKQPRSGEFMLPDSIRLKLDKDKAGEVVTDITDWQRFQRYLADCDAPRRTRHSIRHLYAKLMAATGVNLSTLKDWLGHKDIATTDHYASGCSNYEDITASWGKGNLRLRPVAAEAKAQ